MLETDSGEYEQLTNAVIKVLDTDNEAMTCELGLRAGGGSKYIIDALAQTNQTFRTHIAVDPYGNIEYETAENNVTRHDYTNTMRDKCLNELYFYNHKFLQSKINILFFNLEDTEFFNRFSDGVPVYKEVKKLVNKYCLVHFDAPHAFEPLKVEFDFFIERAVDGAVFIFDDIGNYDHTKFENEVIFKANSETLEVKLLTKGERKASYVVYKN